MPRGVKVCTPSYQEAVGRERGELQASDSCVHPPAKVVVGFETRPGRHLFLAMALNHPRALFNKVILYISIHFSLGENPEECE